ncbi:unnamed protein product, partial [Mesorhabditis belari]|uniref:Piwi domain-containing protein n=1 Tax=Mesorhabditis belari TaxID=2138241 RepID=A0AAF3ETW7_9BILA
MDLVAGIRQLRVQSTSSSESEPVFMPAKPMEANPLGEPVALWSNVFPVKVHEHGVKLYQYEVDVFLSKKPFTDDMEEKDKFVVTRTPFHGARAAQGKEICGKLMECVFKQEEVLPWNKVFYDHHRMLFTTERIDNEGESIFCQIPLKEMERDEPVFKPFAYGKVELVYKGELEFSEKSISTLNGAPSGIARAKFLGKFVEIAASKYCLDGVVNNHSEQHKAASAFLYLSGNRVYSTLNGETLPEGKELLLGLRKTFDLIEGTQGRGHVEFGIPMDASKVCFIRANFAIETAKLVCKKTFQEPNMFTREDVEKLNRVLKGAVVVARYSNIHQNMKIDKIVMENACTQSFKTDLKSEETTFTVEEYFRTQRNETLKYPYAPLAQVTRGGRQNYFPLEFLGIMAGNVVHTEKQTPEIMSTIVKSSAMVPLARMNAIIDQANQQKVLGVKEMAGLIVEQNPYEVNGRILPPPQFQYQGQSVSQPLDERGSWKIPMRSQYAITKKVIRKWAFFVVKDGELSFAPNPFMARLILECNAKGLCVPAFAHSGLIRSDQLEATFQKLVVDEYDFAFFAMDDQLKLQDQLKYLERKYSVATQNVKLSTVEVIVSSSGRPATVANIVQKLNCKMGGLNHSLARQGTQFNESFKDGNIFVLGIGDVMPLGNTPGLEVEGNLPVVLSYAGNFSTVPNALIGDFMIENLPLDDAKISGAKIFDKVCEAMAGAKRRMPKNVVIYRMGSTDLDMKRIMEQEIKEIRGKLDQDARLLYIMVHKDHAVRFFKKNLVARENPTKQNIRPGTVVDTCVTHPHHREFYLNAHVGLQGTAKTPRYTVLYDDSDSTMAYLEAMTYDLCFMHQIVNLPTALPSPLRIAEEYGNRGKRILLKHWEENGVDTGNFQNLKQALEYKYAEKFKDRRINA